MTIQYDISNYIDNMMPLKYDFIIKNNIYNQHQYKDNNTTIVVSKGNTYQTSKNINNDILSYNFFLDIKILSKKIKDCEDIAKEIKDIIINIKNYKTKSYIIDFVDIITDNILLDLSPDNYIITASYSLKVVTKGTTYTGYYDIIADIKNKAEEMEEIEEIEEMLGKIEKMQELGVLKKNKEEEKIYKYLEEKKEVLKNE